MRLAAADACLGPPPWRQAGETIARSRWSRRCNETPPMVMLAATLEQSGSDESLAMRARNGEHAAFVVLAARWKDRIHRLAMRMTRNASDAEEIVQETFLRAYQAIRWFQGESRFGTWLYRIAMNQALMRRRASKRKPTESLEALMPRLGDVGLAGDAATDGADVLADRHAISVRVREALERLDESHRAALVLRDLEELTAEEAAEVLGVSPEAVRQRAHRARLKLREMLGDLLAEAT
ncbi:MAG TPA: sigma-70 family RNA polymerase sigma factor [Polyangiaceae bacterium]